MMSRILIALFVVVLLPLCSCSDEETVSSPTEPSREIIPLDFVTNSDPFIEASLELFLVREGSDEWVSMIGEMRNHSEQSLSYDTGGCGCSNPYFAEFDEEGTYCRRPGPLCPCWVELADIDPGQTLSRSGPICEYCGNGQLVRKISFCLSYFVREGENWTPHFLEVSYLLPQEWGG